MNDFYLVLLILPFLIALLFVLGFAVYFVIIRRPLVWGRSSVWILGEWNLLYNLSTALERLGLSHEVTPDAITLSSPPATIHLREGVAEVAGFWIEPEDEELGKSIVAELRTIYSGDDARLGVFEAAGAAMMLVLFVIGSGFRPSRRGVWS